MPADKKHILILGGTGFIGKAFYEHIVQQKGYHIHLLIRTPDKQPGTASNITIYQGDIRSFDWRQLTHFPDFVFHFARINSSKGRSWGRKWASIKGNLANKRLLSYLKTAEKKVGLIYLSGSLMYGNNSYPITEKKKLNPISFSRDYIIAEKPILQLQKAKSLVKVTFVRVPWVLGDGSWFKAFYLNYIQQHQKIPLYGDGNNTMSFVTLNDLISCLLLIPETKYKKTFNISYPDFCTQEEFVLLMARQLNLPVQKITLRKFEKAIIEAFRSNIPLSSKYSYFNSILKAEKLDILLKKELGLILKDV